MTIVEAAFALPVLLMFIFGLVDLGMWTFNANQATNAARDGARRAILDYEDADDPDGVSHALVVDAVRSRLESDKLEDVTVTCVDDGGDDIPCSSAQVDVDSIRVEVAWNWHLVTPVAAVVGRSDGDATGSATMKIVGRPLAPGAVPTPDPDDDPDDDEPDDDGEDPDEPVPSCGVLQLDLEEPNGGVKRKKIKGDYSGQLETPIPVMFRTDGAAGCTDLRVQVESTDGQLVNIGCGCDLDPPDPPNFRWSYDGSDNIWFNGGQAFVRVLNGDVELRERSFWVK